MAAVFTADYEGLYSMPRKAVGVVCDSTQQYQEARSKVNQQVWCLLWNLWGWEVLLAVTLYCHVHRSLMSVTVFHVSAVLFCCVRPLFKSKAHHLIWRVSVYQMTGQVKTTIDWTRKLIWISSSRQMSGNVVSPFGTRSSMYAFGIISP